MITKIDKTKIQVLESKIICRQPDRYIGWPSIARRPDGELVAVFSGDRDAHVCPFGKTFLVRSPDNGKSWSAPELVNNTPLDDRDAGVCALPDGAIVVSWFTSDYADYNLIFSKYHQAGKLKDEHKTRWDDYLAGLNREDARTWTHYEISGENKRWLGYWTRRSVDGGHTWETPSPSPCSAPHGPAVLSDGRLFYVGTAGHDRKAGKNWLAAAESRDGGATWNTLAKINAFPIYEGTTPSGMAYLCEPHVVQTASGKLIAMARHEETPRDSDRDRCVLWQFESEDGGRTWTEPRPTKIWGKPPHLLRLRDGRLLATYGHRRAPFGQRACLSYDEGRTWDYAHEIILRDDAPNGDLGYPATTECEDGTLVTVYYQVTSPKEKTVLMATRWRLDS